MSHKGKIEITIMFPAGPEQVAEGDRIFKSHAAWMARTHHREGAKAMLLYNLVKGPERENAMDPSSKPTGNTIFVLTEYTRARRGWTTTGSRPRRNGKISRPWVLGPARSRPKRSRGRR